MWFRGLVAVSEKFYNMRGVTRNLTFILEDVVCSLWKCFSFAHSLNTIRSETDCKILLRLSAYAALPPNTPNMQWQLQFSERRCPGPYISVKRQAEYALIAYRFLEA